MFACKTQFLNIGQSGALLKMVKDMIIIGHIPTIFGPSPFFNSFSPIGPLFYVAFTQ